MKKKLLIIEDENSLAKQLKWALMDQYSVTVASDARHAKPLIASNLFPVVTLDLGLPPFPDTPVEGFRLLEEIRSVSPFSKVVVLTGNSEEENAIKAIGMGAADFCVKPVDLTILGVILSRTYRIYELEEANRSLERQCSAAGGLCGMLGISEPMIRLFERIKQVSSTDYPVLLTGESGTGKEMAARAVHALSRRAQKPLVVINCGAIPENLLESELFGHEKGAFTGAVARKTGKFEQAQEGTVFLDEIGDMPLALQVKILRFLQEGTIERLGGNQTLELNVRVVAATNVDLEQAVAKGNFREDLLHRLNVVPLVIPPLRQRPDDVVLLAQHFILEEASLAGKMRPPLSSSALAAIANHSWPGNVRELRNRIRRALTFADGIIEPSDLELEGDGAGREPAIVSLNEARDRAESKAIRDALAIAGGNITQAARLLEVSRPTLHDLLKKHHLART